MNPEFLLRSFAARPCAEPADAVKFLYQSEFGCGHLLPDEAACAQGIRRELAQTAADPQAPAFEPVGNGLCRLSLAHPTVRALPPERIARMMRVTEAQVKGSAERFGESLALLRRLAADGDSDAPGVSAGANGPGETGMHGDHSAPATFDTAGTCCSFNTPAVSSAGDQSCSFHAPAMSDAGDKSCSFHAPAISDAGGVPAAPTTHGETDQTEARRSPGAAYALRLPFSAAALEAYLQTEGRPECLPPRHSPRYRAAYRPAYRVVLRRYGEALPLLAATEAALAARGRAVIVLDGDCASGKTTLAALLLPLYRCDVIHMDDFFLPFELRTPERMAEPGGNVHYERFQAEVLTGLLAGTPFAYGAFDCHTGKTRAVTAAPGPVTIIEGSYALHPKFAAAYEALQAVRALLTVDRAEQVERIRRRNGEAMLKRFREEWIPLEIRYFEAYHSAREGVLVIPGQSHAEDEPPQGSVSP